MTTGTKQKASNKSAAESGKQRNPAMQGEGNYEAAREFNQAERKFVDSGKVSDAARNAAPKSDSERREMAEAEAKGRERSKGEDEDLDSPTSVNNASRDQSH